MALSVTDGLIAGLRHSAQRRLSAVRVLVALTDQGVTCAWQSKGQWVWVDAEWPPGACIKGRPQQPEAMADLIADLLLDVGLVGARVELLLPLDLCEWRVLDGLSRLKNDGSLERSIQGQMSWRFEPDSCYVSCSDCSGSILAVAVSRVDLQAWIDLFEQADLPLDRVDWLLSAAYRGILNQSAGQDADLAWMIATSQASRLLLIRNGVPELDRSFVNPEPDQWVDVVGTIETWRLMQPPTASLLWHLTASSSQISSSSALVEWADQTLTALELSADGLVPWSPTTASSLLDPLISLGFEGLGLARRTS